MGWQRTLCGAVPTPPSIPGAARHRTGLPKAGGGRRVWGAAGAPLRAPWPRAPIAPRSAPATETWLGRGGCVAVPPPGKTGGSRDHAWFGMDFLKAPPKAFQSPPPSEQPPAAWDLLQRQLPVFRHSTCSGAAPRAQLQPFHPSVTQPHEPVHSDTNHHQLHPKKAKRGH